MSSSLIVPLVIWGHDAPTHCISSLLMTSDQHHIVTGCNDGQLCIWDIKNSNADNWQIHPQTMLFGHTAAVTCLAMASGNSDASYIVSSSDNGEMCLWDLSDGRCLEHTRMPIVHTSVQAHHLLQCNDVRLICNGYYPEIHIVHPRRLEILFSLVAQIQPDWISALCILRPVNRDDDVVVAVSNSGTVKVWTIHGSTDSRLGPQQPVFEDESKQLRCLNAQTLRCCAYNQRTVLIVCSKYWQIYDAGDFSLLCSESSRRGERWTGGEFIGIDRIAVWSNEGRGYLYRLPTNSLLRGKAVQSVNPESEHYRRPADPSSPKQMGPQPYLVLDVFNNKPLECTPILSYYLGRRERESKMLLRGDSDGRVSVWIIPDVNDNKTRLVRQESFENLPVLQPKTVISLQEEWSGLDCAPEGIIDQLNRDGNKQLKVTASVYMPSQGKLACGRDDGSIVLVLAIETIVLHLLDGGHDMDDVLPHQTLSGHAGRVTCLLYPYNESPRYNPAHLVSGGTDFAVYVWDINTATKLHVFCVHGGEILQLSVPPDACNTRVLHSVCSVASDHSLSLLSLRDNKCVLLASRQLFPIQTVKWRPHDDFIVIGCTDGSVYVWQMETGHLDRVVHGVTAEEILDACDEKLDSGAGDQLGNPTISIAQAVRRHNFASFRHLATQQIKKAQDALEPKTMRTMHPSLIQRAQSASPFVVQGLRTNTRDPESHIVYFDTEALIVQLLSEEYASLSPDTLEALGFFLSVTKDPGLTDTQKKVFDFISKVRDKAENVGQSLQAKVDGSGIKMSPRVTRRTSDSPANAATGSSSTGTSSAGSGQKQRVPSPLASRVQFKEANVSAAPSSAALVTAQVLMSCLHAWGLDTSLDQLCVSRLGLLRPRRPITFGFLSRASGHMSLSLPGWYRHFGTNGKVDDGQLHATTLATAGHWQLSSAVTTQHLLAVISVANTLMSMSNATFVASHRTKEPLAELPSELDASNQSQTKQGWSLLATLHCIMLPDLIGPNHYRPPLLEMLARRWQDRCLEIREASQALLLAELRRVGVEGRRHIVDEWSPFLPSNIEPPLSLLSEPATTPSSTGNSANALPAAADLDDDEDENGLIGNDSATNKVSALYESRRKQATAIVMMGVIGAEFGTSLEGKIDEKTGVAEGFGIANYAHARHTSRALTFLLLHPPTPNLPSYSMLRRAAVDLLGRGFMVWEPFLDISTVLLGLLELCVDGDTLVPSVTCGLPLSSRADACRTARHGLALIATAKPAAFIITMAKEVARYNALAQNAQAQHHHHQQQLHNSVLVRGRPEILHIIELLIDKIPNDIVDLLIEVMDVTVHCLDQTAIKTKGLQEVFPAIGRFCMINYCNNSRRICVGAKNGSLAFYDLKQGKCQILPGHGGPVSAVAFSPDGKVLASYSYHDNRLMFWQAGSASLFSIGSQQTKCVKTFTTPPIALNANTNPLKLVRIVWVDNRTVALLVADGTETRYRL